MTNLEKENTPPTNFISLEMILGKDSQELSPLTQGTFDTQTLGTVPFTSVDFAEYKQMKKACTKMVPNGTGGMVPDIDDDKLMLMIIVEAVDKDPRSNFTFRNAELLKKLGKTTDIGVAQRLLKPGEIVNFAVAIQKASGFGADAQKAASAEVKNS